MVVHRTYCRFCVANCGALVEVDADHRVVGVRGDPGHPLSQGYLCPKGRAIGRMHHHPDRLGEPLLGRGNDRIAPGWEVVLDDLAGRLRGIVAEHGPSAVAAFGGNGGAQDGAGYALTQRLLRALGSRGWYTALTIDSPAKALVADLMAGYSGLTVHVDDDCPLVVLIGTNPVISHGHTSAMADPVVRHRDLARRAQLWVVDPRRTETAALASRHLAPHPGTDHAILAHLVREILADGADEAYLSAHATQVDELRRAVAGFDRGRTSGISGVAEADLSELVHQIRLHRRIGIVTGTGATMAASANLTEWLAWALLVVTGSFERPAGMWFNPGPSQRNLRRRYPREVRPAGPGPASRPELPRRWGQYPCVGLVDEILSGNVRALIVNGGNPLASFPEPDRVREALEGLEVLVDLDLVRNDVSDLATHVLPCAGDLERADASTGMMAVVPAVFAQRASAAVPVGADRRPAWRILAELAERLDLEPLVPPGAATDEQVLGALMGFDPAGDDIPWGVVEDPRPTLGWVARLVLPGGRWQLAPPELVDQLASVGSAARGPSIGDLVLVPRRQPRHMNSALIDGGGPPGRADVPLLDVHPADARARGVGEGDLVVLTSAHGRVTARAHLDERLRPGVVSLPHGFVNTNVNHLTSLRDGVDGLTGMVTLSGVTVSLHPATRCPLPT